MAIIFLVFLFIFYSIPTLIQNKGFAGFLQSFDWIAFFEKFLDLAFIPFLLTLMNYLRLYVVQQPVTVVHERIDADELFSEYFEKVVNKVTRQPFSNKRLVVFVDNLDRLTEDKMVEALESLKTYISNDQCIFVVACDDNVVRSVINRSKKIPNLENDDQGNLKTAEQYEERKAGEHYLDKFFQQTFRLPEYMGINLHDFAMKNFETTQLCGDLKSENIDIRHLISVLLPSDVNSPRKVKRILNEFIALFEIVKRRENEEDGQIRRGLLTSNPEFMGKFSTIRTEYPEFYKSLVNNTALLSEIDNLLLDRNEDKTKPLLSNLKNTNTDSLLSYLRKTLTIMVEDIEPYIWLSQDTLALGLKREHNMILRISLADGDIDRVIEIIDEVESDEYKALLAQVASRIVEQRLVGIEQQNGTKVIANLLPMIEQDVRLELAHVAANLVPRWAIDTFSADEIFNVLRWAKRGMDIQRKRLISHIIDRLDNAQLRKETFEVILKNADVIAENEATDNVQLWLEEVLSEDQQAEGENQDFAEWFVLQIGNYQDNELALQYYLSDVTINYGVCRMLGEYKGMAAIPMADEGFGQSVQVLLEKRADRISDNDLVYWNSLHKIIVTSESIYEIRYSLENIKRNSTFIPTGLFEQFIHGIFLCLERISKSSEIHEIVDDLLPEVLEIAFLIRRIKDEAFDIEKIQDLPKRFANLLQRNEFRKHLLKFSEKWSNEFGSSDSELFISGTVIAFQDQSSNKNLGTPYLRSLVKLNDCVYSSQRKNLVGKIFTLASSNNENELDVAISYIKIIGDESTYHESIKENSAKWISIIGNDAPPLLQRKLGLFVNLVIFDIVEADRVINQVAPHIPYGGNVNQLNVVVDELLKINDRITPSEGAKLFEKIISQLGQFESLIVKTLKLLSKWFQGVEVNLRSTYHDQVHRRFSSAPSEYLEILTQIWPSLNISQIQQSLIQLFELAGDPDFKENRNKSASLAFSNLSEAEKTKLVKDIWAHLAVVGEAAEEFMNMAIKHLSLEEILQLREAALKSVRDIGASPDSDNNLRLLSVTIRDDMREIMPVVDLFVNLFGRGSADVDMALKYVIPCLKPLNIRNDHKHKLAEAMGKAALRTDDESINDQIHDKANQLGLKWFSYRKYWK